VIKTVVALLLACALAVPRVRADRDSSQGGIPPCPASPEVLAPKKMIRPKYPQDALRKGIAAKVELRAVVTVAGKTKDIAVLDGDSEFSRSAVAAVRKWPFRPASSHGHLVETIYKIHVRFNPVLRVANSDVEIESPRPDPLPASLFAEAHQEYVGDRVHRESEEGVVPPKQIYSPEPEFSEKARKAAEQGTVTILLIVGTDGLPRDPSVVCSSAPDLNENALEAVKHWRFAPGTKDGKPIMVEIAVEVQFHLG
jgi:TonB family protein